MLQVLININCIKALSNMILESTFLLTEWCLYGISLPNIFVDSEFINCFISRLDKFWYNQDVLYNWEADFTGTGNRTLGLLQSTI